MSYRSTSVALKSYWQKILGRCLFSEKPVPTFVTDIMQHSISSAPLSSVWRQRQAGSWDVLTFSWTNPRPSDTENMLDRNHFPSLPRCMCTRRRYACISWFHKIRSIHFVEPPAPRCTYLRTDRRCAARKPETTVMFIAVFILRENPG